MDGLAILAVFIPMVTAVAFYSRSSANNAWGDAAMLTGLKLSDKREPNGWQLSGKIGRATVHADAYMKVHDDGKARAHVAIEVRCDIPDSLVAGSEAFWARLRETREGDSHDLGGVAFDEYVVVRGVRAHIFALFGGETRARFRHLCQNEGIWVDAGAVHLEQTRLFRDGDTLARLLRSLAGLAIGLSLDGPVLPDKLGVNAVTDPNEVMRLRTLHVLIERYPESQATLQACKHALGDASGPVRVEAAAQLGLEGLDVLERAMYDARLDLEVQLSALEAMRSLTSNTALSQAVRDHLESMPMAWKIGALTCVCSPDLHPGTAALCSLLADSTVPGWLAYFECAARVEEPGLALPLAKCLAEEHEPGPVTLSLPLREPEAFEVPEPTSPGGDLLEDQLATEAASAELLNDELKAEAEAPFMQDVEEVPSAEVGALLTTVTLTEELLLDADLRRVVTQILMQDASDDEARPVNGAPEGTRLLPDAGSTTEPDELPSRERPSSPNEPRGEPQRKAEAHAVVDEGEANSTPDQH